MTKAGIVKSSPFSNLRVLLIESDAAAGRSVELYFRGLTGQALLFQTASSIDEVGTAMNEEWDAIMLDLGGQDGEQTSLVKASERLLVHRPVIRLGKSSDHLITSGAETALDETLSKIPVGAAPLLRSAGHLLERRRLESKVEELEKKLEDAANTDSLSGLLSNGHFNERLMNDYNTAVRYGHVLTICMFEIAKFDAISDTYGYIIGNEVLRSVGEIVIACSRKTDYAGRVGSSRFCVAFPNTAIPATLVAVERIRDSITHKVFTGKSCENFTIEVNYGVGQLQKEHKTLDEFLTHTNGALRDSIKKQPGHIEISYPISMAG